MTNARIIASGWYVPEKILDNDFFVKSENNPYIIYTGQDNQGNPLFETEEGIDQLKRTTQTDESIVKLTGIRERRKAAEGETVVDMIHKAFLKTDFPANDLDGIIVATVSDDKKFPSVASRTQKKIGAPSQIGYVADVTAACSGFTHALDHARLRVQEEDGVYLVAGVETLTRLTDYKERNCILFGDGCGIAIVGPTDEKDRGILATNFMNNSDGLDLIYRDNQGFIRMPNGRAVLKRAVRGMVDVAHGAMEKARITKEQVDFYVPHQANERIILGVESSVDPERAGKVIRNIEHFGNMSAATEPVAYAMARERNQIEPGKVVVWTDMGSGLSYGSIVERV